jgi:hypothetical protein
MRISTADDLGRESISVVAWLSVGHAFSVAGMRQLDNAMLSDDGWEVLFCRESTRIPKKASTLPNTLERVLVNAPGRIQIKAGGDELVEQRLKPIDKTVQASLHQDAHGPHDGNTFPLCPVSHNRVIGQKARCSMPDRAGDNGRVRRRYVRRHHSVDQHGIDRSL